jgi:hypothetical protein
MMKLWLSPLMILISLISVACGVTASQNPTIAVATPTGSSPLSQTTIESIVTPAPEIAVESTEVATVAPQTTTEPAAATMPEATIEPVEATVADPQPAVSDWLTVEGKTADNLAYLGNPDAPVTMIDYSDFL